MREKDTSWVVYMMPIKGTPDGMRAVCERKEWDLMEKTRPGFYTLIQADITNEGEAEKLARGTSGDRPPRSSKRMLFQRPPETEEGSTATP